MIAFVRLARRDLVVERDAPLVVEHGVLLAAELEPPPPARGGPGRVGVGEANFLEAAGLSGIPCGGWFHSADLEQFAEGDGELRASLEPLPRRASPVCGRAVRRAVRRAVWRFRRRLVGGQAPPGPHGPARPGPAELGVRGLDGVRGAGDRAIGRTARARARARARRGEERGSPDPGSAAGPARRRGASRPRARPRRPRRARSRAARAPRPCGPSRR